MVDSWSSGTGRHPSRVGLPRRDLRPLEHLPPHLHQRGALHLRRALVFLPAQRVREARSRGHRPRLGRRAHASLVSRCLYRPAAPDVRVRFRLRRLPRPVSRDHRHVWTAAALRGETSSRGCRRRCGQRHNESLQGEENSESDDRYRRAVLRLLVSIFLAPFRYALRRLHESAAQAVRHKRVQMAALQQQRRQSSCLRWHEQRFSQVFQDHSWERAAVLEWAEKTASNSNVLRESVQSSPLGNHRDKPLKGYTCKFRS